MGSTCWSFTRYHAPSSWEFPRFPTCLDVAGVVAAVGVIAVVVHHRDQHVARLSAAGVLRVIAGRFAHQTRKTREVDPLRNLHAVRQLRLVPAALVVLQPLHADHQHRRKLSDRRQHLRVALSLAATRQLTAGIPRGAEVLLGARHPLAREQHLQRVFQARHVHHRAVLPLRPWKRGNEEGEGVGAVENLAAVEAAAAQQALAGEELVDGGLRVTGDAKSDTTADLSP